MRVMILAAGRGERMRPLTDHTPKPLLCVAGVPLIEHHIRRLAAAGLCDIVINVSHLGQQIVDYCGDGGQWGASISYSLEETALETAGGILQALPLLGEAPFLVMNGDIWTDYPLEPLAALSLRPGECAHLVLVGNPPQHPSGDFQLDDAGWVRALSAGLGWTYAGMGVYSADFFGSTAPGKLALRPLLDAMIEQGRLGGQVYRGEWQDVGTPERLEALDHEVKMKIKDSI